MYMYILVKSIKKILKFCNFRLLYPLKLPIKQMVSSIENIPEIENIQHRYPKFNYDELIPSQLEMRETFQYNDPNEIHGEKVTYLKILITDARRWKFKSNVRSTIQKIDKNHALSN